MTTDEELEFYRNLIRKWGSLLDKWYGSCKGSPVDKIIHEIQDLYKDVK